MNRSFFHYLMTLRGGGVHDTLSIFATEAGKDIQFPKHSSSYEEISSYLELNVDYLSSMDIFDEAWEKYLENNHDL
ncbi:YozE family protein [Enterococcus faecium]|uniref:YozE family protein n=1 Tax=Enterococcus faecium TaxID=1352 RepID=UPI0023B31EEF|nr:YozE family protein [Enterococcus faecium]